MSFTPRDWSVGPMHFLLERPDLLAVRVRGVVSLEEVQRVLAFYEELGSVRPFVLMVEMNEAERLERKVQRYLDAHIQPAWIRGFIYINARLIQRSIAIGMLLAHELIQDAPHPWRGKIHFVSSRDEGLALYTRLYAREETSEPTTP